MINNEPQIVNLNLGTGIGTSVLQLINTYEEVNCIKIPFQFADRRNGDIAELVADNSYAKELINWTPKRGLKEMCRDSFNWQIKNPYGFSK